MLASGWRGALVISRHLAKTTPQFSASFSSSPSVESIGRKGVGMLCVAQSGSAARPLALTRAFASEVAADGGAEDAEPKPASGSAGAVAKNPKDRRSPPIGWETSVEYLKSDAYRQTYGTQPVWKPYRRQHKGAIPRHLTRKSCIKRGLIVTGSPCPLCRDEYLTLDYRHTDLLKQFLCPHTGELLKWSVTNICMRKHYRLTVELMKARHFGTMQLKTPFRHYDYSDYYDVEPGSAAEAAMQNAAAEQKHHQADRL